jgi:hypothetical protein
MEKLTFEKNNALIFKQIWLKKMGRDKSGGGDSGE